MLLVPLILFAQSTDLLCSEALGGKRGVATDTHGPKTAAQSLCAHNSHEQYGCSASTVLSRKSAHGRCILLSHQTRGWALFRVFLHSTLKERPPLFTYTSSAITAIEQQARVRQSPPSTSTSLESLATSPLTTSSSLLPSAG